MADTAVVLFDWKADKPEAIDLKRGQIVTLSDRSGNWWKGTADGKTGKFPSNYVALTKDAIKTTANFNYEKADDASHLKFKKGETIEVLKKDATGWWVGRNAAGVVGTFPANHVQEGAGVSKPKDEGSSRSGSSSRSRSPSSRSRSQTPSSRSGSSRSRSRSGSGSGSRSASRSPSDSRSGSVSRSPSPSQSRSRSGSASSRSASSRSRSSASSASDKKKAAAKPAAPKEEAKPAAKAAPVAAPAAPEVKARSAPLGDSVEAPAKPAAKEPPVEPKKEEPKVAVEAKPAPAAVVAKPAPAPAPVAKAEPAKAADDDSASERSASSSQASKRSGSSQSKSKSKSKSKSASDRSASERSASSGAPRTKPAEEEKKPEPVLEKKEAVAAPAAKPAAPVEEKKPAPAKAAAKPAPKEDRSASSRSPSPSQSRSRSRSPSPSSRSRSSRKSDSPKRKSGKSNNKEKERVERRDDDRSDHSDVSRQSDRSGSEGSSFVEGFHPAIKIPDAQDKDDLKVLLMINESQDAVKVRHALEGIQDIIHLDKSGLIAKKSGAIPALSKKVQSLIAGGRPKVVKKDLDTCLDLLHQLVLDDFLAACDANDTGLTNPLVSLVASEAAQDTKARARAVLIALTAEENEKSCNAIVTSGNLLVLANIFADGEDSARRDVGIVLARVLRVSGRHAQNALRNFHAFSGIVSALNSSDEQIQEAAAGVSYWSVKDSGVCKNRFRAAHGLLPLARLISSPNAKVASQAAAAAMELASHNSENAKHFAKGTSAIPNLVIALRQHSLSHEGVVYEALVQNVCGATWNIIRDRQYRVLAFLDEGIISPLIPLVERNNGPAHHLSIKLQQKAPEMVQAHFYLSMEERWIKYQLAMQDYARKYEAAILADYRGEPIPPGVLDDQVKYDPHFTHHDHDPNVHRHAPRIPAIKHFVAAGFNGPNVHTDPLLAGAPSSLQMHHTLALPAQPPSYSAGNKIFGIFAPKNAIKSQAKSEAPRRFDVPAN